MTTDELDLLTDLCVQRQKSYQRIHELETTTPSNSTKHVAYLLVFQRERLYRVERHIAELVAPSFNLAELTALVRVAEAAKDTLQAYGALAKANFGLTGPFADSLTFLHRALMRLADTESTPHA